MALFIVFPHSQPFVMYRLDKRKSLFSCGVVCELTKLVDFPGQVVECQTVSPELLTNQMTPGSAGASRQSHVEKWDQNLKIIATYVRKNWHFVDVQTLLRLELNSSFPL